MSSSSPWKDELREDELRRRFTKESLYDDEASSTLPASPMLFNRSLFLATSRLTWCLRICQSLRPLLRHRSSSSSLAPCLSRTWMTYFLVMLAALISAWPAALPYFAFLPLWLSEPSGLCERRALSLGLAMGTDSTIFGHYLIIGSY